MSVNEKLTAIADKIREYAQVDNKFSLGMMPDGIDMVYETGHVAGMDDRDAELADENAELASALTSGGTNDETIDVNASRAAKDLVAIKTSLVDSYGMEIHAGSPSSTYPNIIDELVMKSYDEGSYSGVASGQNQQYNKFWDAYQYNGTRANYAYAFRGVGWTADTFEPKYDMDVSNAEGMFERCMIVDCNLATFKKKDGSVLQIDFSNASKLAKLCNWFHGLIEIGDIYAANISSSDPTLERIFYLCGNLKRVGTLTVREDITYTESFWSCTNLTHIIFAGTIGQDLYIGDSPLDKESIDSIFDCLSTTASGKTVMLSRTATESAYSNEELTALIADNTNWTINLL